LVCTDTCESVSLRCTYRQWMSRRCTHENLGLPRDAQVEDPNLGNKRSELVDLDARKLAAAKMIAYDTKSKALVSTDLGRVAAKYYIRHSSIEIFNERFRPKMSEADVLAMLSMSTEVSEGRISFDRV
jgi:antiviral helicase SLH1